MSLGKATDEDVIARVRECYEAGETVSGGGVTPETVAEPLPITAKQAAKRLAKLADEGDLERDYGIEGDWNHRIGFAPVADDEPEETRRLIADGGHEPCRNPECNNPVDPDAATDHCSLPCVVAHMHGLVDGELVTEGGQ